MVHRAVPGGYDTEKREGKRTAVFGEMPFFDPQNSVSLSEYTGKKTSGASGYANGHANGVTAANGHSNGKD